MFLKYKIVSDSMKPLILEGSEIEIETVKSISKLKKFDILLFKYQGKLYCHYFWHQNQHFDKGLIVTRALKSGAKDHPVHAGDVIGKVTNYEISWLLKMSIFLRDIL